MAKSSRTVAGASDVEHKLDNLAVRIDQLVSGLGGQQVKACGICRNTGHPTDMCQMLQDDPMVQVNAVGNYQNQQHRYDPYSNTYNPAWKDHPNFSYGNRGVSQQGLQPQNGVLHQQTHLQPYRPPPMQQQPPQLIVQPMP